MRVLDAAYSPAVILRLTRARLHGVPRAGAPASFHRISRKTSNGEIDAYVAQNPESACQVGRSRFGRSTGRRHGDAGTRVGTTAELLPVAPICAKAGTDHQRSFLRGSHGRRGCERAERRRMPCFPSLSHGRCWKAFVTSLPRCVVGRCLSTWRCERVGVHVSSGPIITEQRDSEAQGAG